MLLKIVPCSHILVLYLLHWKRKVRDKDLPQNYDSAEGHVSSSVISFSVEIFALI